jgi:hypothetical protein
VQNSTTLIDRTVVAGSDHLPTSMPTLTPNSNIGCVGDVARPRQMMFQNRHMRQEWIPTEAGNFAQ